MSFRDQDGVWRQSVPDAYTSYRQTGFLVNSIECISFDLMLEKTQGNIHFLLCHNHYGFSTLLHYLHFAKKEYTPLYLIALFGKLQ
jgi:hypothetical protein